MLSFSSVAEAYRPDPPSPAGVNFSSVECGQPLSVGTSVCRVSAEAHNHKPLTPLLELVLRIFGMSTKQPAFAVVSRSSQRGPLSLLRLPLVCLSLTKIRYAICGLIILSCLESLRQMQISIAIFLPGLLIPFKSCLFPSLMTPVAL